MKATPRFMLLVPRSEGEEQKKIDFYYLLLSIIYLFYKEKGKTQRRVYKIDGGDR